MIAYLIIRGDDPSTLAAAVELHGPYAADAVVHELAPDQGYQLSKCLHVYI